jgi:outer membrane protein assembly factor BamB
MLYRSAAPPVGGLPQTDLPSYGTFANDVVAVDIAASKVKWRFEDPDRQFPFYSSAALTRDAVIVGGRDKHVRSLDLATGKQRWAFATQARVDSSPAVAGDRVVIASGDGRVYVLDLATGKRIWDFEGGAGFTASPAIASGRIVIGNVDGKLFALGQ